jgi:phosphoadenosine phosphosulfate reductase
MHEALLGRLNEQLPALALNQRLSVLRGMVAGHEPNDVVLTTSFGLEDQVLTHLVVRAQLPIKLVTLDTGRMFPEVYDVWQKTERHYGIRIEATFPDAASVRDLVARDGINGFYDSQAARKSCCGVRKIIPLKAALKHAKAWITGLRADQSQQRAEAAWVTFDSDFGVIKASPLLDQTRDQLKDFAEAEGVPLNSLHAHGFVSIGCAPCTRAINEGEEERAGRWWWEQDDQKECGLHWGADGKPVRPTKHVV